MTEQNGQWYAEAVGWSVVGVGRTPAEASEEAARMVCLAVTRPTAGALPRRRTALLPAAWRSLRTAGRPSAVRRVHVTAG